MSASVQKRTSRRLIPSARLHALAHCRGHVEAERLGCLQIDVALDFSGLLDWQVGRFFAIKNPANVIAREAVCLPKVRSSPRSQAGVFVSDRPFSLPKATTASGAFHF